MSATTPDTEVPLLKAIAEAYSVSASSVGDTEVTILKQIAEQLGITVANVGDTEVPILKQIAGYYGISTTNLGDTEVPLLKQIVLNQPGTTITTATLGDTEVPLLTQWLQFAAPLPPPFPVAIASWEATYGITQSGGSVSSWKTTNDLYHLDQAVAISRPSFVAGFTTGSALSFNGANSSIGDPSAFSLSPLFTPTGTIFIVFQPNAIGSDMTIFNVTDYSHVPDEYFEIGVTSDGRIYIENANGAGTTSRIVGSTILTAGTAYQLMLAFDGSYYYLTLDGVEENPLVTTTASTIYGWTGTITDPDTIFFGANATIVRYFNGLIGLIRIYDSDITH